MNLNTGNKQEKKKPQRIQKLGLWNIYEIDVSSQGSQGHVFK